MKMARVFPRQGQGYITMSTFMLRCIHLRMKEIVDTQNRLCSQVLF